MIARVLVVECVFVLCVIGVCVRMCVVECVYVIGCVIGVCVCVCGLRVTLYV